MAGQTVTQAYLLGIRDEREMLKSAIRHGERDLQRLSREMLANIELTRAQGFSGEMADYMRGGRDFWRNQLKKHLGQGKLS